MLQLIGTKAWTIWEPFFSKPLKLQRWYGSGSSDFPGATTKQLAAETLCWGDALYVPRGFLHAAQSEDTWSLHLTLGIEPITWFDLMALELSALGERDAKLREDVSVGFALEPSAAARASQAYALVRSTMGISSNHLVDTLTERFWFGRPRNAVGRLQLTLALQKGLDSIAVRRDPGTVLRMRSDSERATVESYDRRITAPVAVEVSAAAIV